MNKSIFIFVIILSLAFFSCKKIEMPTQPKENIVDTVLSTSPLPQKEWTFLLYDDADWGKDAYDPLNDFSNSVSTNTDINYLVLRDGSNSEAACYEIGKHHEQELLENIGNIDMGNEKTLTNFIKLAKKYFPAKRYIAAFYDHGGGWTGVCGDVYNNISDELEPYELDDAFKNTGGINIAIFTGACTMAAIETAYQVRNSAKYYIASEDVSGYVYWYNMLDKFDALIKSNPSMTSEDLSKDIIALLYENSGNNPYGSTSEITMSAIDLSKIQNFVSAFNLVTDYYMKNINKFRSLPKEEIKNYGDLIDVYDLLLVMRNYETDTSAIKIINNAMGYFNDCIVAECHGDSEVGSYGLSIYFPTNSAVIESTPDIYYTSDNAPLDFKNDCSWDKLVVRELEKSGVSPKKSSLQYMHKFNGFSPTYKN